MPSQSRPQSPPSFSLQAGLQAAFSPAFRPRNLAHSMPSQAHGQHQPGLTSAYRPAAPSQQSVESMKAAAELAEMLQRHRPWQDSDAVPATDPQKATARDAMQDAVARSVHTQVFPLHVCCHIHAIQDDSLSGFYAPCFKSRRDDSSHWCQQCTGNSTWMWQRSVPALLSSSTHCRPSAHLAWLARDSSVALLHCRTNGLS